MTELDQAISAAYASEGKKEDVNKVYLTLLRTSLFVPVKKADPALNHVNEQSAFSPLFAKIEDNYFMLAFDTMERLSAWGGEHMDKVDYVEITGTEVVAGINENVFLCLNLGTEFYKEFPPDEIKQLKMVVSRIEQMKRS